MSFLKLFFTFILGTPFTVETVYTLIMIKTNKHYIYEKTNYPHPDFFYHNDVICSRRKSNRLFAYL